MKNNGGIMSGEVSAHYAFRDNGYADSGFIALLVLLQLLSQDGRPISKIVQEFKKYYRADEVNIKIEDKEKAIQKIKDSFKDGKQDELDGVTIEYQDWWFNVRPSNTEPLLRITVEADDKKTAEEKTKRILEIIQS
jgi:phosphomannomutase